MFNNPGGKIKGLAKVLFYLMLIIYVIGGIGMIVFAFQQEVYALIAAGIGVILLGILLAWLTVLFTYAYGSMVEDVKLIRERLDNGAPAPRSAPVPTTRAAAVPTPLTATAAPAAAAGTVCPKCGKRLAPGAGFCGNCGTSLRPAARPGTMNTPSDSDL